jgi:PAS domain S-box-containing protein
LALSAAGMGTWDWDIASGRVEWSEGLERIHGLPPGGFGGTFDDFQRDIHREDREALLASIADAVSTGADYRHDYRIRLPDGTIRWLSVRGQVFHEGSTPVRMAGVGMDITERKELEQRLELKDAVADVLTDAGSVESAAPAILEAVGTSMGWQLGTMWVVDEEQGVLRPAGRWAAGSPAAPPHAPDTDLGPGVGLAGRVWSAASPVWIRDLAAEPELLVDPVGDEMPVRSGFGFAAMLGRRVVGVLEFWSRSIRDPEPSSLQMVRVLGSQIGQFLERKGAEQAVLESEAVKTAVLSSSLEAIITMDEVGRVVELNPAAETMFGIRREEVVGRELAAVLIPEPYRARHREGLDAYRRTGRGAILGRRVEMTGLRSDGEEFPIELSVVRVDLPGPALFTATIRDIADRRRAQELRLDLLAKERAARGEAEAARDRLTFLADASVILASSLDTRRTLAKVARLAVPRLADWCSVDLLEPDGSIHSVAVAHVDPEKIALAREYRLRFPPKPDRPRGAFQAVRTGEPYLIHEISDEELRRNLADPEELSLGRQLGIRSIMVVPLVARGRGLGAVTFASAESGRLFGPPDLELAEDLARRAALAIDNAGLYEERSHIARTLQRSLLPSSLPEIPGVEVAALYQPATITRTEVGGDFYDLFEIGPDAWGVAMGDVCGKGVEAAALTGLARHTVRAAALRRSGPRVVLDDLNEALRREGGDRFCTVVYSRLERGDGGIRMITSCGGHPLPVLIRAEGTVEPIAEPGTLIGIFEDLQLSQRVVELHPGDAVLFFTDGLIDPRVAVPMDEPAVHELLGACAGLSAQQIVDRFKDAMEQAEALDDLALLALRVTS